MAGSLIFFSNFKESRETYPTTAKRSRRAVKIAGLMLGLRSAQRARPWFVTLTISLGRLPATVFKLLTDRHSERTDHVQAILKYVN